MELFFTEYGLYILHKLHYVMRKLFDFWLRAYFYVLQTQSMKSRLAFFADWVSFQEKLDGKHW